VKVAIAKERTAKRPKLEFMRIIRSQVGLTCTPEDTEVGIIRSGTKQTMKWCIIINALSGRMINEMSGGEECLISILKRHHYKKQSNFRCPY
jgi:hypothetical protein